MMEFRTTKLDQAQVRIETREDEKRFITGYAAVFYREGEEGTEYWLYRDLVERISPKAFKRALKEKDDVRALFNHDANQLLSRIGSGLKLKTDEVGLRYEFPVDENDPDHQRVVAKIERGDLSGSSFGFFPEKRIFIEEEDFDVVVVESVRLVDVSPVTFPAYTGTEVGVRNTYPQKDCEVGKRNQDAIGELLKERDDWKIKKNRISDEEQSKLIANQLKANAGIQ